MLKPETEIVWNFLKNEAVLRDFVLIGGTALALRIQHRVSEDLDLCCFDTQLPRKSLEIVLKLGEKKGFLFETIDDPSASDEFELAGMDLRDFQQDFLVNNLVKVSFFTADDPLKRVLNPPSEDRAEVQGPRTAELDELFRSKAIVSAKRSKTRDWFDLFFLMKCHGFTIADYRNAFDLAGILNQWESGISRICSGKPQATDEGFEELVKNPPTLDEISAYFRKLRDQIEERLSEESGPK